MYIYIYRKRCDYLGQNLLNVVLVPFGLTIGATDEKNISVYLLKALDGLLMVLREKVSRLSK